MANYIVSDTNLTAVADAIRTKGGTSAPLEFPDEFVSAIGDIQTGGGSSVTVEALSVTQNGTYTAPTGTAYSPVTVNVSGGAVGLHLDELADHGGNSSWEGYIGENNRIIDAKAPGSATSAYIGFTGLTNWNLNSTVSLTFKDFLGSVPSSMTAYIASNRGSKNLGTISPTNGVFTFTGTNTNWRRDISGMYIQDKSNQRNTWSCTVSLSVDGTVIF